MIETLAISGYRSLRDLVLPLGRLNLVTGANGSGKSSLYRALRLLGDAAQNSVVASLARKINPALMVVVALFADIAAVVFAAVAYSLIPLIVLGLTAGLMQYLAKVGSQ